MNQPITKRYDFVYLFDVQDGNPNGDPDAGNLPRIDSETGFGLVTDVCLKRKVRNYVQIARENSKDCEIFIKEKAVLNLKIADAYKDLGINLEESPINQEDGKKRNTKGEAQGGEVTKGRQSMCKRYFDIRTFGAVMSTGANAGQVRGPIQLVFGRSVEPVVTFEHSITRMAVTTEADAEKQSGDNRTMGRKYTIPYGLYRTHGFISAHLASQTGFGQEDLDLFWEALANMFEHDRSAARGMMSARGLYVFEHDSALGNAQAHSLFEKVTVARTAGTEGKPARSFGDYAVTIDEALPTGIKLLRKIG